MISWLACVSQINAPFWWAQIRGRRVKVSDAHPWFVSYSDSTYVTVQTFTGAPSARYLEDAQGASNPARQTNVTLSSPPISVLPVFISHYLTDCLQVIKVRGLCSLHPSLDQNAHIHCNCASRFSLLYSCHIQANHQQLQGEHISSMKLFSDAERNLFFLAEVHPYCWVFGPTDFIHRSVSISETCEGSYKRGSQ